VAAVTLGILALRHTPRGIACVYGGAFLLLSAVLVFGGNAALAVHGDGGDGARGELRIAQSYDLAGALTREPALVLPTLAHSDPELAQLLRTRGAALYSLQRLDAFMNDGPVGGAIDDSPPGAIFAAWRELVLGHPGLYLAMRWPVFWQVLATPDLRACHPFYAGVDGDPGMMRQLGLARRWNGRDSTLARYANAFVGTPVFSHLTFAALAAIVMGILLRRRSPADLAVAGLLAGALLFTFTFIIVSVACDYRYLYFLDLAAMAGTFYAARNAAIR
jgi:hypothetical protein